MTHHSIYTLKVLVFSPLPGLFLEVTTVFNFMVINHLFIYLGHVCIYSLGMYNFVLLVFLALQKCCPVLLEVCFFALTHCFSDSSVVIAMTCSSASV